MPILAERLKKHAARVDVEVIHKSLFRNPLQSHQHGDKTANTGVVSRSAETTVEQGRSRAVVGGVGEGDARVTIQLEVRRAFGWIQEAEEVIGHGRRIGPTPRGRRVLRSMTGRRCDCRHRHPCQSSGTHG